MTNRGLLRRHLRNAWVSTMQEVYKQQLISSERALQVHFAARLMEAFKADRVRRYVFVEPRIMLDEGHRIHPDLLVCNSREVIGAIELKYQPNVPPRFLKDFATLDALAEGCTSIRLENRRYRGPGRGELGFQLSANPLFVWAGVYRSPRQDIRPTDPTAIDPSQLMVLHAVTRVDDEPKLFARSGSKLSTLKME
jgi:hypothetical protein